MREISNRGNYINLFDNIFDLTLYLKREPKEDRDDDSENADADFAGTKNYNEAFDLLRYGDESLLQKVKEEQNKIKINKLIGNAKKRQAYFNNITGIVPNVPNFLLNVPNNMIDIHKVKTSQRIINIFICIGCSWATSRDEIIRIGTKYLSVIELLESLGYRCNLYAGVTARNDNYQMQHFYVRIKTDREPLNIKKICFPIAHPSMLRRIFFRWAEVNDADGDITHNGYGCSNVDIDTIKQTLEKQFKDNILVFSYSNSQATAKKVEEIVKDLEKAGIKINVE